MNRILQRTVSPFDYKIQMLTGEAIIYNSSGQLAEIWDDLKPTPNKVVVGWDGSGNVSTVTDAQGKRRLLLSYTSGLLTTVQYQFNSGTWVTQHTTTYSYTSGQLTGVSIGGASAQTNAYTSSYLTSIVDAAGNKIASLTYATATPGQIVRVDTPRGMVGFEYASTRTTCSAKSVLYFNLGSATSCSIDSDCGAGFLCGGKTGTGTTGKCFRAARCMTVTSPNEDLVTTVTPLGPPSESCTGACTDVSQYVWSTGTSTLDLQATQDPVGNYISRHFNSDGLPDTIIYGDNDALTSNGGGLRTIYLYYDTVDRGKVKEVRRVSDLSTFTCDAGSNTNGCARTVNSYGSDRQLLTVDESGTTLSSSGSPVAYKYTTSYTHDSVARLTQSTGPAVDMKTVYEYWSSAGTLKDGFLQNYKRYKDATNYLVQSSLDYDFRGNVTGLLDVDSTTTCFTYDTPRGYLASRRETMAAQTDCTTNAADLTVSWLRNSALRLTKLTRADGSCLIYEYDTSGRLARTKRRDDCNAASAGDREEYVYDTASLLTEIDTYDASSTITRKQIYTYYDSLRLQNIVNPVDVSKWRGLVYDNGGMINEVDHEGALGKTTYAINADRRVTGETRYKTSTTLDTWTLAYDFPGDQKTVTDPDTRVTTTTRDDLGRIVKVASVDQSYPSIRIYDQASRLTSIVESLGGGTAQKTHNFTYDALGRQTSADYASDCSGGRVVDAEVVRIYDATGCAPFSSCTNLAGRLARETTNLMCDGSADYGLHQDTIFSYDGAGRVIAEYISDETGRTSYQSYGYTNSGELTYATVAGHRFNWDYGSAGSNSDTDRITKVYQGYPIISTTTLADNVLWNPYGPLKQYNQQNTTSGIAQRTRITRNLAYRPTGVYVETQTGGTVLQSVVVSEDAKGRVTSRDYTPNSGGVQDSYFIYDQEDRLLCETTTSVASCPSSGTNIKNSHNLSPPFTNSGDWKQILRPIAGSTGGLTNVVAATGSTGVNHQIYSLSQTDGSPTLGLTQYSTSVIGSRTYDDNTSTLTNDFRGYTYDDRHNLVSVTGEFKVGGATHIYVVSSAFDGRNRRVFKSFKDTTAGKEAQWFFYYDVLNRLSDVEYTPDITAPSTYSSIQMFWLRDRLSMYWQTDYPSGTASKRYVGPTRAAARSTCLAGLPAAMRFACGGVQIETRLARVCFSPSCSQVNISILRRLRTKMMEQRFIGRDWH